MSHVHEGIAIVGMAGRFPGANSVDELWKHLLAGRDTVSTFSDEELTAAGLNPAALRARGHYVPARGTMAGADTFDAAFFAMHPREAEITDPQQRVFLEECWTALEHAGHSPSRFDGAIGVFAGAAFNTYYLHALHHRQDLIDIVGAEPVMFGNEKDYLATRVAYKLGLKGPALTIATACSTSLVAVAQACQSLLTYQSDLALAGGVSITVPQTRGYFHDDGNIGSADGRTRTFDEQASGTVFSNGVGVVVLRRLEDAMAAGDHIYAVIKAAAINNDGSQRVSFGAPGIDGQAAVIASAHALAGIDPATISYVEAHGTATPLGDPIEIAGLTKAFRFSTDQRGFCAIGSIKTNIGHLDVASGVAGLIKATLALHHGLIPPSLHFTTANPKLELEQSPFYVATALQAWRPRAGVPRRAGVSSFGTGGTNAHAVLEESPETDASSASRPWQLLPLSARTSGALDTMSADLSAHLLDGAQNRPSGNADRWLADVAFTLQTGRSEFAHRRVVTCNEPVSGAASLATRNPRHVFGGANPRHNPAVVFMFPGQGAQYAGMGQELYRGEPVFRAEVDHCADVLRPVIGADLRQLLFPAEGAERVAGDQLRQTAITQPALFTIEYALARLWMSWGITPAAMIGHSVGEYVAGCLAGVFTLEDALRLVAERGALVQAQPPGGMLAIRMAERDVRALLRDDLAVAAVNAPDLCVVAGSHDAIAALEQSVTARGVGARRLHTSHAFHSPMMEPVVAPFTERLRSVTLHPPRIPYVSNVTARWITQAEATSPEYWAAHVRDTVRFADGIGEIVSDPDRVLLEVGPGRMLATLARQHPSRQPHQAVLSSLPAREDESRSVIEALGRLWLEGANVDWSNFYRDERRCKVALPTYPFERQRHWPDSASQPGMTTPSPTIVEPACAPATPPPISIAAQPPMTTAAPTIPSVGAVTGDPTDRLRGLRRDLTTVLEELSGSDLTASDPATPFFELGLDSLLLTQVGTRLQAKFGVRVSFRQLMEDLSSVDALAEHLHAMLPVHAAIAAPVTLRPGVIAAAPPVAAPPVAVAEPPRVTMPALPVAVGPYRPVDRSDAGLTSERRQFLDRLIERYNARTRSSKQQTQANRKHFADPRTLAGFRPYWKEMVYPIVVERSAGSRMWDVDGNEYIDFTMGFGTNLLGHSPAFVTEALARQLSKGVEVGPQTPLAGRAAELMCELTGMERCAFVNTGSEAVLAAIRVARTVTGRARIVYFTGDYHGIFDEVLQRAAGKEGAMVPIAPGIPPQLADHVLILPFNDDSSIDAIRAHGHDIAAVVVEPVQSRYPSVDPRGFLGKLRKVTEDVGCALVFDELITGFRAHSGGVQALFGIRADIATYGKIIGGGMPVGAVCGSARFLDALDGGYWQYGDQSVPESGVTFFAGTYVRHPLAMAGAVATLEYLRHEGPPLQERLTERTTALVGELNRFLRAQGVPIALEQFSSFFWTSFEPKLKYANLLFFLLRDKGIHIFEGRLFFISTAHSEADLHRLIDAFKASIVEMQDAGFLPAPPRTKVVPAGRGASTVPDSIALGVYFFGNYPAAYAEAKYDPIIQAARFADQHGFRSIWLPERHFHPVGGFSPNPAVMAAALARETTQIQLRAGSVVLPLHHPIRVAEEWSLVDNLSNGRVGLSVASGWHPNDFAFAPEAYERRREITTDGIHLLRRLWSGESVKVHGGTGQPLDVRLFPQPKQRTLPLWLTCVQAASYEKAGELGVGVLAMLTNQTLDEVAEKIAIYRDARARHGHEPASGHVTMLVHTYVGASDDAAVSVAREPMRQYLRSYLDNSQKRHDTTGRAAEVSGADLEYLLDRAFDDYRNGKALIGSPESCAATVDTLRRMGVNEIGCFVDFGVAPSEMLAALPHLAELKRLVETPRRASVSAPRQIRLSDAQQGLYHLTRLTPAANRAYAESVTLRLRGPLDLDRLRQSIQLVVNRHEGLRATVNPDGETQTVHAAMPVDLGVTDLAGAPHPQHALAVAFASIEAQSLDLETGPTLAAHLLAVGAGEHLLVLMFHHLFGNGPSYEVFFNDLTATYAALNAGRQPQFETPMQLSDYVRWLEDEARSAQFEQDRQYWLERFRGGAPVLELPTDRPRPPVRSARGGRRSHVIGRELTARLRKANGQLRASMFVTLYSGFAAVVSRLSGQAEVVVGASFEGPVRGLPGGAHLFANTTNVMPILNRCEPGMPFGQLVAQTKAAVFGANDHQRYFFGRLVADLKIPPDRSRMPIVAVSFNFERGVFKQSAGGLDVELVIEDVPFANPTDAAKFEMMVNVADLGDRLRIDCDYIADLFDGATVGRWLEQYEAFLQDVCESPDQPLGVLGRSVEASTESSGPAPPQPIVAPDGISETVHEAVEHRARLTPDAIAVRFRDTALTYRELDRKADALASLLTAGGVNVDSVVPVCLERSADMAWVALGVLKAGAAYLPIDPGNPTERLRMILDDAKGRLVITQSSLMTRLDGAAPLLVIDRDLDRPMPAGVAKRPAVGPSNLAYVIYTSGSTGRPKGVMVEHRAFVNALAVIGREPGLTSGEVMLSVNPWSFDLACLDLFLPLTTGATLVVAPSEASRDMPLLQQVLEQSGATLMDATPTTWQMLVESGWGGSTGLRIMTGGDRLSPELARALLPRCRELWNLYGPTETTIYCTGRRVRDGDPIDMGTPFPNTELVIVDDSLEPVAAGQPGEILIGGACLARGYLNRPDLTSERFLPHPRRRGATLYRSGDLGRLLPNGCVESLGRADFQMKVRGFRVEAGEIESALLALPGITRAVALMREDAPGVPRLVAYISGDRLAPSFLRSELARRLPEHAVPSAFVHVDSWPLTPNGKLDRKSLPRPQEGDRQHAAAPRAPRTDVERRLARLWSEVLDVDAIGPDDDFFNLGGHSLLAMRLLHRILGEFGARVSPVELIEHSELAALAKLIEPSVPVPAPAIVSSEKALVRLSTGGPGTPFVWVNGIADDLYSYIPVSKRMGSSRAVYGLTSNWARLLGVAQPTLEAVAACYVDQLKAQQPHGPYHLGGWCAAALLALEMARQLRAAGDRVGVVAALDYDTDHARWTSGASSVGAFAKNLPLWLRQDAMIAGTKDLQGRFKSRMRRALDRPRRDQTGHGAAKVDLRDQLGTWRLADEELVVLATHHATLRQHRPQPFHGQVTLFVPTSFPLLGPWPADEDRGWSQLASKVDVRIVKGSHSTMMGEPFAEHLAHELDRSIGEAERVISDPQLVG